MSDAHPRENSQYSKLADEEKGEALTVSSSSSESSDEETPSGCCNHAHIKHKVHHHHKHLWHQAHSAQRSHRRLMVAKFSRVAHHDHVKHVTALPVEHPETGEMVHEDHEGLSFHETVANFVVSLVGVGMLFFPALMKQVGAFVACPLMLTAAFVVYICAVIIGQCCDAVDHSGEEPVQSYEVLAGDALGKCGRMMLTYTKNIYLIGIIVVYAVLNAEGLGTWVPLDQYRTIWYVVLPLFILLAMLKDLKAISWVASICIVAIATQIFSIIIGASIHYVQAVHLSSTKPTYHGVSGDLSPLTVGNALVTFVFGFSIIIATIPSVRSHMEHKEQLPSAIAVSMGMVSLLYLFVMIMGYGAFGDKVHDSILLSITEGCDGGVTGLRCSMGSICAGSITLNLFLTVPQLFFFVVSVVESCGSNGPFRPMSCPNMLMRGLMMLVMVATASALPYAKEIVGLLAAALGCCNAFFFPLAFHAALRRQYPEKMKMGTAEVLKHLLVLLVGVMAVIFGVLGSLDALRERINQDASQAHHHHPHHG